MSRLLCPSSDYTVSSGGAVKSLNSAPLKLVVHLTPALVAGLLLADVFDGRIGAVLSFGVLLVAPGCLGWRLLPPGLVGKDGPGLPAIWIVLSFLLLSPALSGMVFLGLRVVIVELYVLLLLVILGVVAARAPLPSLERWGRGGAALAVVSLTAGLYRALTWRDSADDVAYLGFIRRVTQDGAYPDTNPFLSGNLALAPRWRLDGWTGLTGVISHLGDVEPVYVFRDLLPPLLLLFGVSSLFLLGRTLSGDVRFGHVAGLCGVVVPLLTSSGGTEKNDFTYWYSHIAQNKYTALIVFLPTVVVLLLTAYGSRRRASAWLAAGALWAMLFVHPVPAVFAVLVFASYVTFDLILKRQGDWKRSAALAGLMLVPLLLTSMAVSVTGEPYGTRLGDVDEIAAIASPTQSLGPIQLWEPLELSLLAAGPDDAAAVFISGHATVGGGPRIALLSNGMPIAHWRMLGNPANWIVVLAILVIAAGRHRDPVALWVVGSSLVAVSVFVVPPFAAVVARFITPWQLWRFSWLMPTPMATAWLVMQVISSDIRRKAPVGLAVVGVLAATFWISSHKHFFRTEPPPSDRRVAAAVVDFAALDGIVLAQAPLKNEAASVYGSLEVVAFRGRTTMANAFPSSRRSEAFARLQGSRAFYARSASSSERLEILQENQVRYVVIADEDVEFILSDVLGLEPVREVGATHTLYLRSASGSS